MELNEKRLFLLDMDGTIYIENKLIDGALDFFNLLNSRGIDYVFVTNNSSESAIDYVKKIKILGIVCKEQNVFTSGMSSGLFLSKKYRNKNIYVVGTKKFVDELRGYDLKIFDEESDEIDIVLVGFDKELTYKKIELACKYISSGALYYATNIDLVCPVDNNKFIPDCGSICQMINTATGKAPIFLGKPNVEMVEMISAHFNVQKDKIAVIGDRLYTDIALGKNSDVTSICVLTGETDNNMISLSDIKPDYVFNSISDLYKILSHE